MKKLKRDAGPERVGAPAGSAAKVGLGQASYDYKAHGFTAPGDGHPVVVARMNSYGSVSAPTGHSNKAALGARSASTHH